MKIAKIVSASVAALIITGSAAFAQQTLTGTITEVNRINGTVAVRQSQGGTVGTNTGGAAEQFKIQGGLSLEDLHAGDRVSFSVTEAGGTRTITKLQKQ